MSIIGTLYGTPPSRAARVTWLAREMGVTLDIKPVDIFAGQHRTAEYTDIDILQQVPAFADETASLGESLAITLYLVKKHGGDVGAADLSEEAQLYQWTMLAAGVDAQMAPIMTHRVMLPEDKRDEKAVQFAMRGIARALAGVERHLAAGNEWLVGGRFTVADINMAGVCAPLHFTGLSGDVGSAFAAWLEKCLSRPAAQAEIKPPMAPPPQVVERIMAMMAEG